jgi:hypothetical protein
MYLIQARFLPVLILKHIFIYSDNEDFMSRNQKVTISDYKNWSWEVGVLVHAIIPTTSEAEVEFGGLRLASGKSQTPSEKLKQKGLGAWLKR